MIKKYFTAKAFYFNRLKFEDRKVVHYALLLCVIFLQVLAIVIWYNETANETKISKAFDTISATNKISKYSNRINNAVIQSQEYFNHYIHFKDAVSFKKYGTTLNEISLLLDSVNVVSNKNEAFNKILHKKQQTETDISVLKSAIDSIINNQISQDKNDVSKLFRFKKFESKKILDSIKTDSYMKVDSASRKGLFSRLGDAFAGRFNVQKEQLNTVVTMQYKDKVTSGSIEEQMANLFLTTNSYYENEFNNLKKAFLNLRTLS